MSLEKYRFLCCEAPGFASLKDLVARHAREATPRWRERLSYNIAIVCRWQQHLEEVDILHLHDGEDGTDQHKYDAE